MAIDRFEQYYAEKLWETIPSIYRHEDGLAEKPGVLRAIVQVIAKQAAILRRSQDSLWDDQFIELCNEWAVPYIGDLVATRLLSEKNKRGRRIDVAKTIYYRRRKGTPRILEELISDISGWEGKLVEQFQKLARSRHGLDTKPQTLSGKYSGTLPGGWADLRNPRTSELINGPFEEFFHTPDMRRHHGLQGRYSISKLAFYLYRLKAYQVINSTPFSLGDGVSFSFDPSGRDISLFSKSSLSPNWNEWRTATEPELPAPIPCRLLGHATYLLSEAIIQQLIALPVPLTMTAANELRKIIGLIFKNERSLLNVISSFSSNTEILDPAILLPLLSFSLKDDCGKSILLPDNQTVLNNPLDSNSILVGYQMPANEVITTENITAANLMTWPFAIDKVLAIDAENGRFMFQNSPTEDQEVYIAYHYGFSGNIGAGGYDRFLQTDILPDGILTGGGMINATDLFNTGLTQIEDSKTYSPIASKVSIVDMTLQSANMQRPFICLESNWILNSGANENSKLTFDGLWIGAQGDLEAEIILKGNFECVVIRNCTLDPGGSINIKNELLQPVNLIIEGFVENLCIESCILGSVIVRNEGIIEEVSITDSIVQSIDPSVNAIEIKSGKTTIERSTIFGKVEVHRLYATEVIISAIANVTDTQNGCFRYSAAPHLSRLPHPYESFLFTNDSAHWFTSRRFGDPGFAQLSDLAPVVLKVGGENESEMGAFSKLLNPVKFDGLKAKIDEYMPFGLIPIYINKT
ncbi:MAG: hypothetical protein KA954_05700 [Chitinophagales bacterium]|nr:hypothetical protein [Chitinophagales bacterium]MBP8753311.1 hypothetical protein [Chitinophagales bacterium]MBP9188398.1 hypothetical protein [Chitinophagales bacterium]MBP9548704.1 hypothetical protein [Chitinophagales bacterium]MBP9703436.1 hypothetical protein [Chitinophagales bacterium]